MIRVSRVCLGAHQALASYFVMKSHPILTMKRKISIETLQYAAEEIYFQPFSRVGAIQATLRGRPSKQCQLLRDGFMIPTKGFIPDL